MARFNNVLEIRVQECTRASDTVRHTSTECAEDKREVQIWIIFKNVPLTGETLKPMNGTKNQ